MIRRILCAECDRKTNKPQHPEDVAMGWKRRRVQIRSKKPEVHQIVMLAGGEKTVSDLPSLLCDLCNAGLPDGTEAFAITEWRSARESEPGPWEEEFTQKENL